MYIKNKRGQSTVEYILLVTAVIAVIIAFVTSQNGGVQGQLNSTLNSAYGEIDSMTTRLGDALPNSENTTANATPNPFTQNVTM